MNSYDRSRRRLPSLDEYEADQDFAAASSRGAFARAAKAAKAEAARVAWLDELVEMDRLWI